MRTQPAAPHVGRTLRLKRILPDGRSVVFAFDHGMEHGPKVFTVKGMDPRPLFREVVDAGVDAIMTTPGTARLTADIWMGRASLILKASGRTQLRPEDKQLIQTPLSWAEEAIALGAEAIAYTVYWGTPYEHEMLQGWTLLRREADRLGLPLLQLAYPRGPHIPNRYAVEIVAYATRAAVESGADLIKTYYTGSHETFQRVVSAAAGIPVLMSGGEREKDLLDFLRKVESVMKAGGAGTVVGRNVFQTENSHDVVKAVLDIVHRGKTAEEAYRHHLGSSG